MNIQLQHNLSEDIKRINRNCTKDVGELVESVQEWIEKDLNDIKDLLSWKSYKLKNKEKIQDIIKKINELKEVTGNDIICNNMIWLITKGPEY